MRFLSGYDQPVNFDVVGPPAPVPDHLRVAMVEKALAGTPVPWPTQVVPLGDWLDDLGDEIMGGVADAGARKIREKYSDYFYQRGRDTGMLVIDAHQQLSEAPSNIPKPLATVMAAMSEPYAKGVKDVLVPYFTKRAVGYGLVALGASFGLGWFIASRRGK